MDEAIAAVRAFNRFYTERIGVLREGYLDSPFSLAQVRVLYELAHRERTTAGELARDLGLDPGYVSRIVRGFERQGLVERRRSEADRRQSDLWLTGAGRAAFAPLDKRSHDDVGALLADLSDAERRRLVGAMATIERLLGGRPEPRVPYLLRPHGPGDTGWVVARHGFLYAQEYRFDERFEALVAEIVAHFLRDFDPKRERCWIAEREGENVGCVFLVKQDEAVAKLRLFLVEPSARGLGIGTRLVDECVRFARFAGYRRVTLWTQSILLAARRIYARAGFQLVHAEPQPNFGRDDLVAETWELAL
jgi:DNA-binding MarR family transcriptional regulator/N-acetylglutamate synthase-like GNAT family acetyltransferase